MDGCWTDGGVDMEAETETEVFKDCQTHPFHHKYVRTSRFCLSREHRKAPGELFTATGNPFRTPLSSKLL